MLDVCLLGSGGMMPLPDRWLTSLLVRYKGRMLLIDCGEGTQIPIKMAGWGFKTIDAICFTHFHCDHVAGLPGLLLTIGNSGREEPLKLIGPEGLGKLVAGLGTAAPVLPYALEIIELQADRTIEMNIDGLTVKSLPVDHTLPCFSYSIELERIGKFDVQKAEAMRIPVNYWNRLQRGERVQLEGRILTPEMVLGESREGIKVTYCTDTRPTAQMVDFFRKSDMLICEGMYGDNGSAGKAADKKHMLFSEAAALAAQSEAEELWLTHYSPSLTDPEEYMESTRKIFKNTQAGKDLLTKTINFKVE